MDLKNLISRTSDDESTPSNIPLQKRQSQPRLSIHSLMNDNDNNNDESSNPDNNKNLKSIEGNDDSNIPPVRELPLPKSSESDGIPTDEQRELVFQESNERALDIKPKEEGVQSAFQTLNVTESQLENDTTRIKDRNSISSLTNEENLEITRIQTSSNRSEDKATTSDGKITEETAGKEVIHEVENGEPEMKLHAQIQKLEELKKKEEVDTMVEGKPKRYRTKPTWAQDYIPTITRSTAISSNEIRSAKNESSLTNASKLNIPSLTGSIPRNDFNKLVTEWIWANVEGVKQDYLDVPNVQDYIELELKLGNIWDKVKDRRIQLPVNTECVISTDFVNQECFFKPGITLENYNDTKTFMNKLIQEAAEQQKQGRGELNNKFIIENSHVVDLIASDSRRNDRPISGRVSLDIKTKRKTNSITKQRISDLYLHFPNTLFDLRFTLSLELPKELNDAAFEIFKKRVTMEREKERISYIHQATSTRIDLTKIREKNNRIPKYELELEINTHALLRSMDSVMDDPLYYIDLVQAFLDNGRIITRQLSMQRQ